LAQAARIAPRVVQNRCFTRAVGTVALAGRSSDRHMIAALAGPDVSLDPDTAALLAGLAEG
jgi:hypothetical protein